jgi:heme/copper-type cytochrome/quinol oxidase subunit 3
MIQQISEIGIKRQPVAKKSKPINIGMGRGNGGDDGGPSRLALARFALVLFILSEIMLFGGLLGSFLAYKHNLSPWPPPGQPRYPAQTTTLNTAFLLLSGLTMFIFRRNWHRGDPSYKKLTFLLALTLILGISFLFLQENEWIRLIAYGLTMTSSIYGSIFYVIVGFHAIHVLVACLWLFVASIRAILKKFPRNMVDLETCGIFWYFVVLLWPVIYRFIYF